MSRAQTEPLNDPLKEDVLPPHSLEAETGVLGCILLEPAACVGECIENRMLPEWFYHIPLRQIYTAMMEMHEATIPIDLITPQKKLKDANQLEGVGGLAFLAELPDKVPSAANLGYYVAIIREKWLMRSLTRICGHAVKQIREKPEQFAETMAKTEEEILLLNTQRVAGKDVSWQSIIHGAIEQVENYARGSAQMRGLSTGFDYLDKMCCGLAPGQLILIAGRPGDGKTSLGMNIIEHIAVTKKVPCGVFSLEMTGEELGIRALFQKAKADFQRFRTGYLQSSDIPKLMEAGKMQLAPIELDENGDSTIDDICAKARRWHRERGIRCLLVDYVALVETMEYFRESREKIAYISKRFKRLAKVLKIPVILLVQLNREGEKAGGRLPLLSDLADSDNLGRDADLVLMRYRPKIDMIDEAETSEAAVTRAALKAELGEGVDWSNHYTRINGLIAKQRNGPTGKVEFLFHKASMRFVPFVRPAKEGEKPKPETKKKMETPMPKSWRGVPNE